MIMLKEVKVQTRAVAARFRNFKGTQHAKFQREVTEEEEALETSQACKGRRTK
jgi:hypothetical protein